MNKKAKIIATLGPSIHEEKKLKSLVENGVDAFRINFSHNVLGVEKIVSVIGKQISVTNLFSATDKCFYQRKKQNQVDKNLINT